MEKLCKTTRCCHIAWRSYAKQHGACRFILALHYQQQKCSPCANMSSCPCLPMQRCSHWLATLVRLCSVYESTPSIMGTAFASLASEGAHLPCLRWRWWPANTVLTLCGVVTCRQFQRYLAVCFAVIVSCLSCHWVNDLPVNFSSNYVPVPEHVHC